MLHGVRFLRSYFSTDGRRMLCLYEAPDVESVRFANRQAGLPFDLAWGVRALGAESTLQSALYRTPSAATDVSTRSDGPQFRDPCRLASVRE